MQPRYPTITVKLVGEDGNSFAILGAVIAAMRRAGVAQDEIDAYRAEATTGDYNYLLQITMRWVEVT
jgi:hypothetical protein